MMFFFKVSKFMPIKGLLTVSAAIFPNAKSKKTQPVEQ